MVQERECRCLRLAIRTANCVSRYLPRVADRCCSAPKSDVFVERNHDTVSTRGNHNATPVAGRTEITLSSMVVFVVLPSLIHTSANVCSLMLLPRISQPS